MTARFFLDTEFYEDDASVELISIGVVGPEQSEFYAENINFRWSRVPGDHWLRDNVRPGLSVRGEDGRRLEEIREGLRCFVDDLTATSERPEFWGYVCAYDWFLTARLFGRLLDIPHGWPMHCNELKQLAMEVLPSGVSLTELVPQDEESRHNALEDAWWNQRAYNFLTERKKSQERAR